MRQWNILQIQALFDSTKLQSDHSDIPSTLNNYQLQQSAEVIDSFITPGPFNPTQTITRDISFV
jgi:hypothetical protein